MKIRRVYKSYAEMMSFLHKHHIKISELVLIDPLGGDCEAGNVYVRTIRGYFQLTGGTGSTDSPYDGLPPTYIGVGGLNKGTDINGKYVKEVVHDMLYPYQAPTIGITLVPDATIQEKGTVLQNLTITARVNAPLAEDYPIQWVKFYNGNTLLHTEKTGVTFGGNISFAWNNCRITSDTTIRVECSDGNNTAEASKKITYVNRAYYGTVPNGTVLTFDDIKNLQNSVLKLTKSLKWEKINGTNCYIVYAYPMAQGELTTIKDVMNFECLDSYTRTVMPINGENYYVYRLTYAASIKDVIQDFK